jgi:peptide/nickel transport system substrate-binding protein
VVEKMGDDAFGRQPIGSGPFKVVEWRKNDSITYARNENYWLRKPTLQTIVMKVIPDVAVLVSNLLAGDLDVIDQVTAAAYGQLQGNPNYSIQVTPAANYWYLGFANLGRTAPFNDKRLRQAVYHSIDIESLAKVIAPRDELGARAYSSLPSSYWPSGDHAGFKALALQKDAAKAKQLFDEVIRDGVIKADDPVKMVIGIDPTRTRIGEITASSIKEMGRNGVLDAMEYATYLRRIQSVPTTGESFIFVTNTTPFAPDPDTSLYWLYHTKGGHGPWLGLPAGGPVDKALDTARASQDSAERDRTYNSLMKTALGDVFNIPIVMLNVVVAANRKVQGLKPSPRADWQFVTKFTDVSIVE